MDTYQKYIADCWIPLHSGTKFFLLNPRMEDINIEDIAHSLSQLCRFNGSSSSFYSVAQHSVIVSQNCNPASALHGLLHDCSEGLGLGDIVSPLKQIPEFEFFRKIENNIQSMVYRKFGLEPIEPPDVKLADLRTLATEAQNLKQPLHKDWVFPEKPYDFIIEPLMPREAKELFLQRFKELTGNKYV